MTQFRKRSSGPLGPEGYRAVARKLRRFADALDSRADSALNAEMKRLWNAQTPNA